MGKIKPQQPLMDRIWMMANEIKPPHSDNSFYLTGVKIIGPTLETPVDVVHTDSDLYLSLSLEECQTILNEGIQGGVLEIARRKGRAKIVSLRQQIRLNEARGAFKKVEMLRGEALDLINKLRKLESKTTMFTQ